MEAADETCVFEKLIVAQHEYVTGNDTFWEDGEALRRSTRSTLDMSDMTDVMQCHSPIEGKAQTVMSACGSLQPNSSVFFSNHHHYHHLPHTQAHTSTACSARHVAGHATQTAPPAPDALLCSSAALSTCGCIESMRTGLWSAYE
jgi:hypothetical protein